MCGVAAVLQAECWHVHPATRHTKFSLNYRCPRYRAALMALLACWSSSENMSIVIVKAKH